jgi:holo-[acyl-carrier protein] synthase
MNGGVVAIVAVVSSHTTPPECRVGVDLTALADVAKAIEAHGDRYLRRIYTDDELASCASGRTLRCDSLAARFAAKEAVVKVLEPVDLRPPWLDIEVRRGANGACRIELHRAAARLAAEQGIGPISVSLSHEGEMAVAVAACWAWPGAGGATERV